MTLLHPLRSWGALLFAAFAMALAWPSAGAFAQAASAGKAAAPTRWDELVPKDWDPAKGFRQLDLGRLSDADPKVQQLMRELREAWDNAPTNRRMDGATVRLAGYVVPLDEARGELREFLLVPYFGACIHTPPPPANQIVHVTVFKSLKGIRSMDPVWVTGTLRAERQDSSMGVSGYAIQGAAVERYVPGARR